MSRIEFGTAKYEASHGKKPRGTGTWGFIPTGGGMVIWGYGSLTDAKRQVRPTLVAMGITRVEVAP